MFCLVIPTPHSDMKQIKVCQHDLQKKIWTTNSSYFLFVYSNMYLENVAVGTASNCMRSTRYTFHLFFRLFNTMSRYIDIFFFYLITGFFFNQSINNHVSKLGWESHSRVKNLFSFTILPSLTQHRFLLVWSHVFWINQLRNNNYALKLSWESHSRIPSLSPLSFPLWHNIDAFT